MPPSVPPSPLPGQVCWEYPWPEGLSFPRLHHLLQGCPLEGGEGGEGGRGEVTIEEIVGSYSGWCQELKTWLSPKNGVFEVFWSGKEEQTVFPATHHPAL